MSKFSGKRYQGALRDHKKKLREEAEARQVQERRLEKDREARANDSVFGGAWLPSWGPTPTERLLMAINGISGATDDPAQDSGKFGTVDDNGDIHYLGATLREGIDF